MYDIGTFYQAADVPDAIAALKRDPHGVLVSGGTDVLVQVREGRLAGCSLVSIHGLAELTGVSMVGPQGYMDSNGCLHGGPNGSVRATCDRVVGVDGRQATNDRAGYRHGAATEVGSGDGKQATNAADMSGTVYIGAATPFAQITASPIIQECVPMLGYGADQVGSPQIRNVGTIGGNVCNGVTSADTAPALFAYNATLALAGESGVRLVPIREFYTGPGKTVRRHEEVLVAVLIAPEDYRGFSGRYIKYGKREAMEISTLGCACLVKVGHAGEVGSNCAATADAAGDASTRAAETNCEQSAGVQEKSAGVQGDSAGVQYKSAGVQGESAGVQDESAGVQGDIGGRGRKPGGDLVVTDLRLAFGVAAPTPMRCTETERKIIGLPVCEETFALAGELAMEEVQPRSSWRASREFRLQLVRELTVRALREAVEMGRGGAILVPGCM